MIHLGVTLGVEISAGNDVVLTVNDDGAVERHVVVRDVVYYEVLTGIPPLDAANVDSTTAIANFYIVATKAVTAYHIARDSITHENSGTLNSRNLAHAMWVAYTEAFYFSHSLTGHVADGHHHAVLAGLATLKFEIDTVLVLMQGF